MAKIFGFCHKFCQNPAIKFGLWQKSVIRFPAHRGTVISKLIDSCIVCVNECDMSPVW